MDKFREFEDRFNKATSDGSAVDWYLFLDDAEDDFKFLINHIKSLQSELDMVHTVIDRVDAMLRRDYPKVRQKILEITLE
jgi:hypothetical protein